MTLEFAQTHVDSHLENTEESRLWKIANEFRYWVCSQLRILSSQERETLRGDYLFYIDNVPKFVVMINEFGAWSATLYNSSDFFQFVLEAECPLEVTYEQINDIIKGSYRSCISTDSHTLHRLLVGTLKARIAFIKGKVTICGDLAAFLKMVSLLKRNGVKSLT